MGGQTANLTVTETVFEKIQRRLIGANLGNKKLGQGAFKEAVGGSGLVPEAGISGA